MKTFTKLLIPVTALFLLHATTAQAQKNIERMLENLNSLQPEKITIVLSKSAIDENCQYKGEDHFIAIAFTTNSISDSNVINDLCNAFLKDKTNSNCYNFEEYKNDQDNDSGADRVRTKWLHYGDNNGDSYFTIGKSYDNTLLANFNIEKNNKYYKSYCLEYTKQKNGRYKARISRTITRKETADSDFEKGNSSNANFNNKEFNEKFKNFNNDIDNGAKTSNNTLTLTVSTPAQAITSITHLRKMMTKEIDKYTNNHSQGTNLDCLETYASAMYQAVNTKRKEEFTKKEKSFLRKDINHQTKELKRTIKLAKKATTSNQQVSNLASLNAALEYMKLIKKKL